MSDDKTYPILASAISNALLNNEQYLQMYKESIQNPDEFWSEQAETFVTWFKKWDRVQEWNYNEAVIKWFDGAKLNVAYNCLDRHLETKADEIAIIWEGDDPAVLVRPWRRADSHELASNETPASTPEGPHKIPKADIRDFKGTSQILG